MIHGYRDLTVWQKAMNLVVAVYALTEKFPKEEVYGLTSQMRRAAVSIPSNIAEGRLRGSRKEYRQFLLNAYGSGGELETQIAIAQKLPFGQELDFGNVIKPLDEVMRMLNRMLSGLKS